tara:strand:+ start:3421 stop:3969 length:549 start_codon:yes stop_codon:yes gene_type:complete
MATLKFSGSTLLTETSGTVTFPTTVTWPSGTIRNVIFDTFDTRTTVPTGASGTFWNYTFTKLYDASTTDIIVNHLLIGHENYSDVCGFRSHISGSTTISTDGTAYYDTGYIQNQNANDPQLSFNLGKRFESLGAGSHTWELAWSTRNSQGGNGPWVVTNPNSSDDARNHQQGSSVLIFEVQR